MADNRKIVARNRKAMHDYQLLDSFEAGLVLSGVEIKSIRANLVNLQDGWVQVIGDELWLMGVHITPYKQASMFDRLDPRRPRKLLMHRKEINRLISRVNEKGLTLIPTQIYLKNGRAKIEIALARGRKQYDKRDQIAKRESDLQLRRALRERTHE
ncbi:MAG: SsrA-binding protein SmpB [Chloroflexi bacterium]|jgi:SsrA-binding protein|nr:SsrA-binding protein SmpB [Chloroflexota bacterium]MBV6435761.1 SsrA-binding protein [Anaerolineae bacterium]MDL1916812.1 SsrA-binding protein SmpB [Anaerolineae bacterium CFX4]OQY79440.1 MAG: SsrA-binding protein [Anaerolineae bacterium UTCFX5]MBW7878740.1 SsrA-binding protein SmpB [Anaerolineae bacterium]